MHAFGTPNNCYGTEVCNWHKDVASTYTYGASIGTPDWEHTGCALLWGHNPGTSWIAQARQVADARARGAKLIVVDPRRAGAANKADLWLRVRPGTDGALALGIARVVLEEGWFDRDFVCDLTNAPFLVLGADARLLRGKRPLRRRRPGPVRGLERGDGTCAGRPARAASWRAVGTRRRGDGGDPRRSRPLPHRARCLARAVRTVHRRRGGSDHRGSGRRGPDRGRDAHPLRAPVAYYAWSGVGQHTNATQTDRAISCLYALTGSLGRRGGNVEFAKVPVHDVSGRELVTGAGRAKTLGPARTPAGPSQGRVVHVRRPLSRHRDRPALPGPRSPHLRRQPPRLPRWRRSRDAGARSARLSRARGHLSEPHRRVRGHRAAGQHTVGTRGATGRIRDHAGRERPGPTPAAGRGLTWRVA